MFEFEVFICKGTSVYTSHPSAISLCEEGGNYQSHLRKSMFLK